MFPTEAPQAFQGGAQSTGMGQLQDSLVSLHGSQRDYPATSREVLALSQNFT